MWSQENNYSIFRQKIFCIILLGKKLKPKEIEEIKKNQDKWLINAIGKIKNLLYFFLFYFTGVHLSIFQRLQYSIEWHLILRALESI